MFKMYQTEYRKLKELQFLQATNFLLLTKLIPNIKGDKNFVFNLPVVNDQNKNTSEVKFKLKKNVRLYFKSGSFNEISY